jgi:hypothetical protein
MYYTRFILLPLRGGGGGCTTQVILLRLKGGGGGGVVLHNSYYCRLAIYTYMTPPHVAFSPLIYEYYCSACSGEGLEEISGRKILASVIYSMYIIMLHCGRGEV